MGNNNSHFESNYRIYLQYIGAKIAWPVCIYARTSDDTSPPRRCLVERACGRPPTGAVPIGRLEDAAGIAKGRNVDTLRRRAQAAGA